MASAPSHEQLKLRVKRRLVELLDGMPYAQYTPQQRKALEQQLRQTVRAFPREHGQAPLTAAQQEALVEQALNELVGNAFLDRLLLDPAVNEIMINGPHHIFIERDGKIQQLDERFEDTNHLMAVIELLLSSINLSVTESSPLCDGRLPDGSRINVIIPPVTLDGPVVTIRRKLPEWTMEEYLTRDVLTGQAAQFLEASVKAKVNIVISGGTSTGKTTLLSILSTYIPREQRVITIENVSELELPGRDHWIRLVAKSANLERRGEIPLRALVRNSLRMRPDRILLGEARGGEALDVVQAMHSGHDGFITGIHANSPHAALERLATLMQMGGLEIPPSACRTQIASTVELVVHLGRFADGSRRVAAISQVAGVSRDGFVMEELFTVEVDYFAPAKVGGTLRYTGVKPRFLSRFLMEHVPVPSWITT